MEHPTTQAELYARVSAAFAQLVATLSRISDEQQIQPGAQDDWSVKDILAHISLWHNRTAALVEGLLRGDPPAPLRQPGEDSAAAVDRANAANYAANRDLPLARVRADFDASYARVLAALAQLSDADLRDDGALSQLLGGSLLETIADDTYAHYDEHLPALDAAAAG